MNHHPEWAGLNVLVTGASGFIGAGLCRALCRAGSLVHATSRVKRITVPGGPTWWPGDLADLATARHLVSSIKPDIIFHLSGMVGASPSADLVLPTFHSLLTSTVNLLSVSTEVPLRRMVLVASLTEPESAQGELIPGSPYAAAKWGIVGLTASLAKEMGPDGIRVNAILPGPVRGPRMEGVIRDRAAAQGVTFEAMEAEYLSNISLRRMVGPEDVASLALFLCSAAGGNISGQAISVCGNVETL